MPTFRFQRLCGPLVPLLIFVILCFCSGHATGGTTSSSKISVVVAQPAAVRHNDPHKTNVLLKRNLRIAQPRSATDTHHGRTLIIKSLILAPLALVFLILLLLLLLPIPVVSIPSGRGRSISTTSTFSPLQMARDVLTAEECVERVSCELSRISRSHDSTSWIPSALERILTRTKWSDRILRGMKGITDPSCAQFSCSPAKTLKRSFTNNVVTAK